jgi:hypothetical protein
MGPYGVAWEPDGALYGPYMPDQLRNRGHVNDPKLAAMVQEQRRLKDPEARQQAVFAIQRYAAEQQYYVYLSSQVVTASWQPYVKNYAPNLNADFGSRVGEPPALLGSWLTLLRQLLSCVTALQMTEVDPTIVCRNAHCATPNSLQVF